MLTSTGSAPYAYDALQQRVGKAGVSSPNEAVYFNGKPVALLNQSTGAWTDLVWAGSSLLAEVTSGQPQYRLLDHEGSLIATADAYANLTGGINSLTPYGEPVSQSTNDPYLFANLFQDSEDQSDAARYRNYSTMESRWLSPDPYNGSYDINNPQSFNRYMYVNGNPLAYIDPSGLSIASDVCSALYDLFGFPKPGDSSNIVYARKLVNYSSKLAKNSCSGDLIAFGEFVAEKLISRGISGAFSSDSKWNSSGAYFAYIQAAIAIGCSIDYNKDACGDPQLAWLIPGGGGDVGKAAGDLFAVGFAICSAGALTNAACDVVALYELADSVYDFLYDLFGWGPAKFTGSLLPRPADMGGLGTSPIGIPNKNLNVQDILGRP